VAGGWRRPHNKELHIMYASPNIIRMMKSRIMRWVGHVARIGAVRSIYNILVGNLEDRDDSEDPGVANKMILEWIFGKYDGVHKVFSGYQLR
jgi:hypothetical protein